MYDRVRGWKNGQRRLLTGRHELSAMAWTSEATLSNATQSREPNSVLGFPGICICRSCILAGFQ